jgi:hypothetical protein
VPAHAKGIGRVGVQVPKGHYAHRRQRTLTSPCTDSWARTTDVITVPVLGPTTPATAHSSTATQRAASSLHSEEERYSRYGVCYVTDNWSCRSEVRRDRRNDLSPRGSLRSRGRIDASQQAAKADRPTTIHPTVVRCCWIRPLLRPRVAHLTSVWWPTASTQGKRTHGPAGYRARSTRDAPLFPASRAASAGDKRRLGPVRVPLSSTTPECCES